MTVTKAKVVRLEAGPGFSLPDGSSVRRQGSAAEICDPAGRVVVRYEAGSATIIAPDGDLSLAAPRGSVRLHAGRDLELQADGVLRQRGGEIDVHARIGRLTVGVATVLARSIETTATQLRQRAERYEVEAAQVIERSRCSLREVRELARQRVGQMCTIVRQEYTLDARRTVLISTEDTHIDGKRVLLG